MQRAAALEFIDQILNGQHELEQILADVTLEAFNWRSGPKAWSLADCLRHLVLTGSHALSQLDEMIASARSQGLQARRPFRPRPHIRLVLWFMEPPYRVRIRTVKLLTPTSSREPMEELVSEFLALQKALLGRIDQSKSLDWSAVKAPMPNHLRLNLGEWFAVTTAHQRRHYYQMGQVKQALPRPLLLKSAVVG